MELKVKLKVLWAKIRILYLPAIFSPLWRMIKSIVPKSIDLFRTVLSFILSIFISHDTLARAIIRKNSKHVKFLGELFALNNDIEKALNKLMLDKPKPISKEVQENLVKETETKKPKWLKS